MKEDGCRELAYMIVGTIQASASSVEPVVRKVGQADAVVPKWTLFSRESTCLTF